MYKRSDVATTTVKKDVVDMVVENVGMRGYGKIGMEEETNTLYKCTENLRNVNNLISVFLIFYPCTTLLFIVLSVSFT